MRLHQIVDVAEAEIYTFLWNYNSECGHKPLSNNIPIVLKYLSKESVDICDEWGPPSWNGNTKKM